MKTTGLLQLALTLILFLSPLALKAQTVSAIKGQKALLDIGDMDLAAGDRVFTLDDAGKKRSLVQIRQIRNGKAVADIVKGSPVVGHTLALSKKAGGSNSDASSSSRPIRGLKATGGYGYTFALMMNTMKISNFDPAGTVYPGTYNFEMTGTNFGVSGFYDYLLTREWFVRAHGAFEMFDVKKSAELAICDDANSTDCNAKFMQLGLYGTFNYVFTPAPLRWWAGAGGGILIYASKDSTVLDTNKFFFNTLLMAAGGFDYFLGRNTFIPVAFEYQMIPDKEAGVTSMVLRAGWGKTF